MVVRLLLQDATFVQYRYQITLHTPKALVQFKCPFRSIYYTLRLSRYSPYIFKQCEFTNQENVDNQWKKPKKKKEKKKVGWLVRMEVHQPVLETYKHVIKIQTIKLKPTKFGTQLRKLNGFPENPVLFHFLDLGIFDNIMRIFL